MRVMNLNKLIVFATPRTRSQHKKKLRSRNFGADKQYKFDYLFENFSHAKIGLFTGLLRLFVACVLCTENNPLLLKQSINMIHSFLSIA